MALVLNRIYTGYNLLFDELSDPRTDELDLFLMSSPIKPFLIIAAYMYFVYKLGPRFMAHRKPFNLKIVLIIFNVAQILFNGYVVAVAFNEIWYNLDWDCAAIDFSSTPRNLYVLKIYHLFFLIKLADLLDTVFFVLRKKNRQISFLHVYHHFGMVIMLWVAVKFYAGGSGAFIGVINGAVHTVMYTYYLLTAIDDKWKHSVTFKRSITQMQIIQFIVFIIIYGRLLLKPTCGYPKLASIFFVPQNIFMLIMFCDFYRKAYLSDRKRTEPSESTPCNTKTSNFSNGNDSMKKRVMA